MDWYSGSNCEVEFARFLVAKAKFLATVKLFHPIKWSKEDIDSQRNRICISGKASSAAQIYFTRTSNGSVFDKEKMDDYIKRVPLL
jgi:hypothetical protein